MSNSCSVLIIDSSLSPFPTTTPLSSQLEIREPRKKLASWRAFGGEESMWIFDSYFKGCVELWSRERGLERSSTVLAGPGIPL